MAIFRNRQKEYGNQGSCAKSEGTFFNGSVKKCKQCQINGTSRTSVRVSLLFLFEFVWFPETSDIVKLLRPPVWTFPIGKYKCMAEEEMVKQNKNTYNNNNTHNNKNNNNKNNNTPILNMQSYGDSFCSFLYHCT